MVNALQLSSPVREESYSLCLLCHVSVTKDGVMFIVLCVSD